MECEPHAAPSEVGGFPGKGATTPGVNTRETPSAAAPAPLSPPAVLGALLLLSTAGAAVLYKATGAMGAIAKAQQTGKLAAKARWIPVDAYPAWSHPLIDAANYFSWIVIALAFGLAIGTLVRAAVPERWVARAFSGSGPLGLAFGAMVGAPLMLCSCCISPVFDGAYARTRKLGPALALMFAAPGLNPADLAVTFLVFPRAVAIARVVLSLTIVFGVSALLGGTLAPAQAREACAVDAPEPTWGSFVSGLGAAFKKTVRTTLPGMLLGAVASALIIQVVPLAGVASASGIAVLSAVIVAAIATLVALPTFGEIPIGLALVLGGAPTAAVVAVLVAGPIINLPSLMVVRQSVSTRAAAAVGLAVFTVALAGGELAARFAI